MEEGWGASAVAQCRTASEWVRGRRQYAVKGDVTGEKERFLAMVGAVTSEISSVRTGFLKSTLALHWRLARAGEGGRRRRVGGRRVSDAAGARNGGERRSC